MIEYLSEKFSEIEISFIYHNYQKITSLAIYNKMDINNLNFILENLILIEQEALEITIDDNDKFLKNKVKENGFIPNYYWYIYQIKNESLYDDSNIQEIKDRELVKDLLIDQVHELSTRMPSMFDENGEEDDWYKLGDYCIAYYENNEILSVLTYTIENKNKIHVYLTYTKPNFRSKGYGTKMFDYLKYIAYKNNIKEITICTDVSKNNRVPNMFIKNKFSYFKTGYEKILK